MTLERFILKKLWHRRIIGEKHTDIVNLAKGLPKHLRGEAKHAIARLLREGLLLPKPTSYGFHVSLHPERLAEIARRIEEG